MRQATAAIAVMVLLMFGAEKGIAQAGANPQSQTNTQSAAQPRACDKITEPKARAACQIEERIRVTKPDLESFKIDKDIIIPK
jgi:hypothetical protein